MVKLFYSGTYSKQHQYITEENVKEMLKDDIRSQLVDDIDGVIYANDGVVTKNPNVTYIGGFYYEKGEGKTVTEKVVNAELEQIDRADLLVVNLIGHAAIGSVAEIMYAARDTVVDGIKADGGTNIGVQLVDAPEEIKAKYIINKECQD